MKNRIFSTDSPKAVKSLEFQYLNAIQYFAPSDTSGIVNLCSHASPGCIALCLGWFSGQASFVKDLDRDTNSVRKSRIEKTRRFMHDRAAYMRDVVRSIWNLDRRAQRMHMRLCVRLNGASDIAFEMIRDAKGRTIFDIFPNVQFVDYTKNPLRFRRQLPSNYHLTFSRSETNEAQCIDLLQQGHNVAVVFANGLPDRWHGFQVVDGDKHDLRHLDPSAFMWTNGQRVPYRSGFIIGLSPKGNRAKKDSSGFVVR